MVKTSAGRRFFNFLLFAADLALLIWIIFSWRGQRQPEIETDVPPASGYDAGGIGALSDGNGSEGGFAAGWTDTSDHDPGSTSANPDSWLSDPGGNGQAEDQFGEPPAGMDYNQNGELVSLQEDVPDYSAYNAVQRPEPGDFDDWKNLNGSIPAGALVNQDFREIEGTWKGFIEYETAEELATFVISGDASAAVLTVDWYLIHFFDDGSWMNEEDMEDLPFAGTWSDGALYVTSAGSIAIRTVYEWSGQQYAFGEMTLTDGSTALVGMVRP